MGLISYAGGRVLRSGYSGVIHADHATFEAGVTINSRKNYEMAVKLLLFVVIGCGG